MKPLHLMLIFFALFITGLTDGISLGLAVIPGLGIVLDIVIAFCINITMGAGLIFALASNGMFHPKLGPLITIGGLIPGLNFLPFWLGLVAAGVLQDLSKQKGLLGTAAGIAVAAQPGGNLFSKASAMFEAVQKTERGLTGRPAMPETAGNDNEPQEEREERPERAPLNLKSPGMSRDITPHAQAA